jgi:hypothetical protein
MSGGDDKMTGSISFFIGLSLRNNPEDGKAYSIDNLRAPGGKCP